MTATPTPGDLSARQVEALRELRDSGDVSDWRSMESALDAAIAALSALPAGGDVPEDWVRFGFHGERVACRPAIAERVQNALLREVMTGIEQREATTPPADADVGAQGEGYDDGSGRVRDWRAPAAGKGVDDASERQPDGYAYRYADGFIRHNGGRDHNGMRPTETIPFYYGSAPALTRQPVAGDGMAEYVLALLVTGGYVTQARVDEARRIALGCEPAQPPDDSEEMVPGDADDMAEALTEISTTLGCDNTLDDILHAIAALPRTSTANGMVLALKEPTDAMNDAGGRSLNSDLGFPSYRADRVASAARNAYVTMLTAAPTGPAQGDGADTPADGGEGK